jgi:dihydroorotate dehydrogenase electron transfer subunit
MPLMTKRTQDLQIVENKQLKKDFFILELSSADSLPKILPGQFVQIRVDGSPETFLRRPVSFYDVDYKKNTIRLLIQILGKGTETLSKLAPGGYLNLVYPLGNAFTMPAEGENCLLVGGGVGIAPLFFFAKLIKQAGFSTDMLLGFRNRDRIIEYDEFRKYGTVYITTEDGSEGEKGFVTDHSILKTNKYSRIYCCGPDPMMKAVAGYSRQHHIFCEVSLENLMACGFGICLCCIVDTNEGRICTCTDGPVFNINDLKW